MDSRTMPKGIEAPGLQINSDMLRNYRKNNLHTTHLLQRLQEHSGKQIEYSGEYLPVPMKGFTNAV